MTDVTDVTIETLEDILDTCPSVKVGTQIVTLDPKRLIFNEATVGRWLEEAGAWYAYFARQLADAEYIKDSCDAIYETKYSSLFSGHKENGCSDKLADANAKSDPEIEECKNRIARAKHTVKNLQQHLRAWDKAHDSAQNRGNTLRKEMERQFFESTLKVKQDADMEGKIDNIIGKADD